MLASSVIHRKSSFFREKPSTLLDSGFWRKVCVSLIKKNISSCVQLPGPGILVLYDGSAASCSFGRDLTFPVIISNKVLATGPQFGSSLNACWNPTHTPEHAALAQQWPYLVDRTQDHSHRSSMRPTCNPDLHFRVPERLEETSKGTYRFYFGIIYYKLMKG